MLHSEEAAAAQALENRLQSVQEAKRQKLQARLDKKAAVYRNTLDDVVKHSSLSTRLHNLPIW